MTNPPKQPLSAHDDINASISTSSPSPRNALIGLACVVGFIAVVTLVTIYYQSGWF